MRSVSAIIVIHLAYVSCYHWNTFIPEKIMYRDAVNRLGSWFIVPNVTKHYLHMPLDHFDPNENRTFPVWYEQSLDFWKPNGPLYIWITEYGFSEDYGGAKGFDINNYTLTYAMAQETNGAMFMTQKRYYGRSFPPLPYQELSYLKYLNISQHLADIATLIKYLKSKPEFQTSKVVLLGYRREANLATWMRVVYPELVDAALAISAPLLAKKDAYEILNHTAYVYDRDGRKDCANDIQERLHWFFDSLKNDTELRWYKMKNTICADNNFTVPEDRQLYMIIQHALYTYMPEEGITSCIKDCDHYFIGISGLCASFDYALRVELAKMSYRSASFSYQDCLEYGQYPTSSAKRKPFGEGVTLDFFLKYCKDVFGIDEKRMDEGIAQTNRLYGGLTPNVTNVIFTHGELDPYRFLGVQQNLSDSAPAFVIENEGYTNVMYDLYNEKNHEIRERVKTLIKTWIGL